MEPPEVLFGAPTSPEPVDCNGVDTDPDAIPIKGLAHIALTVSDLDRAIDFYTRVLGFDVLFRRDGAAGLLNGTFFFGIRTSGRELGPGEDQFDESRPGLDHVGLAVESPELVQQAASRLDRFKVPRGEVHPGTPPGSLLVSFRDPDNIQWEYYYYLQPPT